jgi:hypothetical protein
MAVRQQQQQQQDYLAAAATGLSYSSSSRAVRPCAGSLLQYTAEGSTLMNNTA